MFALSLTALAATPAAQASKQVVDFFGGTGTLGGEFALNIGGVAVNDTGAGSAGAGDIYVLDARNDRIERFGRDDGGTPGTTPADTADDTYFFISAWGADVVQNGGAGDQGDAAAKNYEICTVASECKAGVASAGNGTTAGNGAISSAQNIAVDPDTGYLYVSDNNDLIDSIPKNNRVNVYDGEGNFLRSFGFDVIESGVNDSGSGYEVCVGADGDVCKAGVPGNGVGQIGTGYAGIAVSPADGNDSAGTVFLADPANRRVNTYGLDGSSPSSIGSATQFSPSGGGSQAPTRVAVDSRGILYANGSSASFEQRILRYDTEDFYGGGATFLPPLRASESEYQRLNRNATAGQFRLSFDPDGPGPDPAQTTADIAYNANGPAVAAALEALPAIGARNVTVSSCFCALGHYDVRFTNDLANTDQAQLAVSNGTTPLTGTITVSTVDDGFGGGGVNEVQELTVSATAGTFRLSYDPDGAGPSPPETTADIPYNAPAQGGGVRDALDALPSLDFGTHFGNPSGGPGDAGGTDPYIITFSKTLGATDVPQLTCSDGSVPLSGGSGCSVATAIAGQPGLIPSTFGFTAAIDPDSDAGGPDTDVLYTNRDFVIQQFGPANAPGLVSPPTAEDARHNTRGVVRSSAGLAVEESTGRLYAPSSSDSAYGAGIFVIDETSPTPPSASLDSVDGITSTSAAVHATVNPNGPPNTSYRLEYRADGDADWSAIPDVLLGHQTTDQPVDITLDPPGGGLSPNTLYHLRLRVQRRFNDPFYADPGELTFTTDPEAPAVETTGSSVRTATTAQFAGRLNPRNSATTYHFDYGPTTAYGQSTPARPAGSGDEIKLLAQDVSGLDPATAYHYRLVADNGVGSPVTGADMTLTTRASDAPLSHSYLDSDGKTVKSPPGPPGSDRAWELVSLADTSGNPVARAEGFSDHGDSALYGISGGTPISNSGNLFSLYFAERPPGAHPTSGWQTRLIEPSRDQLLGSAWLGVNPLADLSSVLVTNAADDRQALWRLNPYGAPTALLQPPAGQRIQGTALSADGTRAVSAIEGGIPDPAYPAAGATYNYYDVTSGAPQLASLLSGPGEGVPAACGISDNSVSASAGWLSPDGSSVLFSSRAEGPCEGPSARPVGLYLRDLPAQATTRVSPDPLSGAACDAALLRRAGGGVFFATRSRLVSSDTNPSAGCAGPGNDVYRYDEGDHGLECLTCLVDGLSSDVEGDRPRDIGVPADGSRLYFRSPKRLLPGAPASGGAYVLDLADQELRYVAADAGTGYTLESSAISSDGSLFAFTSDDPALNPLGDGTDNAGTPQFYLYDDTDRSLVCASCHPDGSAPLAISGDLTPPLGQEHEPNLRRLTSTGTLAFATATPLATGDDNTDLGDPNSGVDVYEFRDGRRLLVTDGATDWLAPPRAEGISPSGADLFFSAPARYTLDATDDIRRLYDARIGGGIDFPPPGLPPCDLNSGACEGPPSSPPDQPGAGSGPFVGPGNPPLKWSKPKPRCPKGKRKVRRGGKTRCVKPHKHKPKKKQRKSHHPGRAHR